MSLAATAIDQPKPRERIIDTMVQYLSTDAICCREEEGTLAARQSQASTYSKHGQTQSCPVVVLLFACHQCQVRPGCLSEIPPTWLLVSVQTLDPILRWARQHFQAEFDVTGSIFGSQHNPDATSAVSSYLQGQQPGSLSNCMSNMRLCLELLSDLTLPCRPGPLGAGSCRKPGRGLSLCADGPSDHAGP